VNTESTRPNFKQEVEVGIALGLTGGAIKEHLLTSATEARAALVLGMGTLVLQLVRRLEESSSTLDNRGNF
jgi:hypothetical protein